MATFSIQTCFYLSQKTNNLYPEPFSGALWITPLDKDFIRCIIDYCNLIIVIALSLY